MMHAQKLLRAAAADFRYLLNRGYPRKGSLDLVGNRYGLSFDERHLLRRGIFSDEDAKARKKRKVPIRALHDQDLAIDGYNVLITIEAALSGRPLISSSEGFIRDISGLSGDFRKTEVTEKALCLIFDFLKKVKPRNTLFLLDAPISKSGLLAREVRERLRGEGLPGDAQALKVPEKVLVGFPGIVATSDTGIIDRSEAVFDLAGYLTKKRIKAKPVLKLKA